MRVATYNVNGVNGRLPRLLEWLDETGPDIVCLQEIKTTGAHRGREKPSDHAPVWVELTA